jgi:hypothetical protein
MLYCHQVKMMSVYFSNLTLIATITSTMGRMTMGSMTMAMRGLNIQAAVAEREGH